MVSLEVTEMSRNRPDMFKNMKKETSLITEGAGYQNEKNKKNTKKTEKRRKNVGKRRKRRKFHGEITRKNMKKCLQQKCDYVKWKW